MRVIYACPDCGGRNVQLNFPCWVDANDIDDREKYGLDFEAQPEKYSDKGLCTDCDATKLLDRIELDAGAWYLKFNDSDEMENRSPGCVTWEKLDAVTLEQARIEGKEKFKAYLKKWHGISQSWTKDLYPSKPEVVYSEQLEDDRYCGVCNGTGGVRRNSTIKGLEDKVDNYRCDACKGSGWDVRAIAPVFTGQIHNWPELEAAVAARRKDGRQTDGDGRQVQGEEPNHAHSVDRPQVLPEGQDSGEAGEGTVGP